MLFWAVPLAAQGTPRAASEWLAQGEAYLAAGNPAAAERAFRSSENRGGGYESALGLARALIAQERLSEARPFLERAIRLRPDLARPRVLLGRLLRRQGAYAQAEEALLAAYNLDPQFTPAWGELLGLYRVTQRPAQALPFLRLLLQRHPRDVGLLQEQLRLARALRQRELRRDTLQRLIELVPPKKRPPYRRELALEYLATGKFRQAEEQLRAALAAEPSNAESALLLAQALLAQGRPQAAAQALQGLDPAKISRPEVLAHLAQAQLAAGQTAQALTTAQHALGLAPSSRPALETAHAAARALKAREQAVVYARRLLALEPRDSPARLQLAEDLAAVGNRGEAWQQWEIVAAAGGPEAREALDRLAVVAAQAGNPDYLLSVARRRAASDPQNGLPLLIALLVTHGRYGEAERHLEAALRMRPADPDLRAQRARVLRSTGRLTEAGELLAVALRANPRHGRLNLEMGLLAAQANNFVAALPFLCRALRAEPDLPETHAALVRCAHLTGQYEPAMDALTEVALPPVGRASPETSERALAALGRLLTLRLGALGAAQAMAALAETKPSYPELTLVTARLYQQAGQDGVAGRYYEEAAERTGRPERFLPLAAAAYEEAGEEAGLLRVAAAYLAQVSRDPDSLALVTEMQATALPLAPQVRQALRGLLAARPGSCEYQRYRLDLFAARGRLDILEGWSGARASRSRSRGDRLLLAMTRARRGDAAGALLSLQLLPPETREEAESRSGPNPCLAVFETQLLADTGDPGRALEILERVTAAPAPRVALARADLLRQVGRCEEALAEYARALPEGAAVEQVLAAISDMHDAGKVTPAQVITALGEASAGLPEVAALHEFVTHRLPAGEASVQAWLELHPAVSP